MDNLIEYAPLLGSGVLVTVSVAVLSLVLATTLGALGAAAKLSRKLAPRAIAQTYTTIVRGIPDLVLILLIYFGGQRLLTTIGGAAGLDYIEISKFWAGVISIGFIYGAYLTETFRGTYLAVPKGQGEEDLRDAFTAAIQAIRDSGEYKSINDKYFEVDIYGGDGV